MKSLSILEWNIHGQGGAGGGNIPTWVKDEVNGQDIVVLTEFCGVSEGRNRFIADLEELGYHCVASENPAGNDILIAVKSCFPILDSSWVSCYGVNSLPENIRADIDCGGSVLTIAGLRIKALNRVHSNRKNRMRQEEFLWALNRIKGIKNPTLIAGDFNNNRRGSPNPDWSLSLMEERLDKAGFALYTPEGSSVFEEKPRFSEFPYDHFAAKGATMTLYSYERNFTSRDPSAYFLGRDFREPWYPGANEGDLAKVAPPFPDHAILKGTLFF